MSLPEGRYLGGRLTADVLVVRSRAALPREQREPDETPLWAADEVDRDMVAMLKRTGTRKGTTETLGRLVDSGGGAATGSSFFRRRIRLGRLHTDVWPLS